MHFFSHRALARSALGKAPSPDPPRRCPRPGGIDRSWDSAAAPVSCLPRTRAQCCGMSIPLRNRGTIVCKRPSCKRRKQTSSAAALEWRRVGRNLCSQLLSSSTGLFLELFPRPPHASSHGRMWLAPQGRIFPTGTQSTPNVEKIITDAVNIKNHMNIPLL